MKNEFTSVTKIITMSCLFSILAFTSCKKEEIEIAGKKETFRLSSTFVKDDYDIFVFIPASFTIKTNENHLIIALDGDFHFDELSKMVSEKSQNGTLPPSIFVAVGNSKNRNRDYTPTSFKHGKGGAANFYQFLTKELIFELESRYNLNPESKKTLMGNSFGGLFTHYAMFQDETTNPFKNFISVGCSYWFDSGIIFEYEQKYADKHSVLPVKFFNGMGTLEGGISTASFAEMNDRLKKRAYKGFECEASFIEKRGHSGSASIGFKEGLDYVFNN